MGAGGFTLQPSANVPRTKVTVREPLGNVPRLLRAILKRALTVVVGCTGFRGVCGHSVHLYPVGH